MKNYFGRRSSRFAIWFGLAPCWGTCLAVPLEAYSKLRHVVPAQPKHSILLVDTDRVAGVSSSARSLYRRLLLVFRTPVVLLSYREVTPAVYQHLAPAGIILSGQGTPWAEYSPAELKPIGVALQLATCPVLGICGGHQLLAIVGGGKVGPIRRLRPGKGYDGLLRQHGFVAVSFLARDPILDPSATTINAWHNHVEEVKTLPSHFICLAKGPLIKIEAMRDQTRPIFGVQFHPEHWDKEHPEGLVILRRFGELCHAKLVPAEPQHSQVKL